MSEVVASASGPPADVGRAKLEIDMQARTQIMECAERAYPLETCGTLVGIQQGQLRRVLRAESANNRAAERVHDRYDVDPVDHLDSDLRARLEGLAIVGAWHSHPDCCAYPSDADSRVAWEGWSYVIVSVMEGVAVDLRSWRLSGAAYLEEEEIDTTWQQSRS